MSGQAKERYSSEVVPALRKQFDYTNPNQEPRLEKIIINIGLQKGIIGPTLFSMLVLMAIVTTMMAGPLFELVYGRRARAEGELGALEGSLAIDAA